MDSMNEGERTHIDSPDISIDPLDALRIDLIARLLRCLADVDRLPGHDLTGIEINQAIIRLGGEPQFPPQ